MPSGNPVYQPTTVTYERHKEWSNNYLTDTVIPNCQQKPCLQRLLLITAVLLAIVGLGLTIFALVHDANTHSDDHDFLDPSSAVETADSDYEDPPENPKSDKHDHQTNVILGSVGITLILISLGLYIGFLTLRGTCRGLFPRNSRTPNALGLSQGGDGSNTNGNPMSVSYKEVQESCSLNLDPSVPVQEERHSLMDTKDLANSLPKRRRSLPSRFRRGRIGAPLASQETLSPSLASSFCSEMMYLDETLHGSDSSDQENCHPNPDPQDRQAAPSPGGHSI